MSESGINAVTVLGTGVLGGQIAWHTAYNGKRVVAYNRREASLEKVRAAHDQLEQVYRSDLAASEADIAGTRSRVLYTSDLEEAVAGADLVIESLPEIPEIKTEYYKKMSGLLPEHTLIATNSSTFLPRDFADATGRPSKYCSLHFANKIWALNMVEIMAHISTAEETLTAVTKFAIEIGQVPIPIQREQNGYVLNVWLPTMLNAALGLVVNGVSTPEDIDRTYLIANRGCQLGPFGIIDTIGMRTQFELFDHWGHANNDEQMIRNAEYLKKQFLDKGLFGAENGKGFYDYPNPAFADPDFLAVPGFADVPAIVQRAKLKPE
jgi:3-hydroxyacyl-CoA dehydrogenase